MDPLTHTLVGASLAATRLGSKTRRASAALVIGANLPDVDVLSYVAGGDFALGFRRGWTHGVLALAVLPALLVGGLWLWDRWRRRKRADSCATAAPHAPNATAAPGLSVRWLFVLSYLAVLTHPGLDWLNTYGMRWLMPFGDTWFFGDSVFIMDPWLWLILGGAWLYGRRPTTPLVVGGGFVTALLALPVAFRAAQYLPVILLVAAVLLAALLVRPHASIVTRQRVAVAGLAAAAFYIAALVALHAVSETKIRAELARRGEQAIGVMVGPTPANPLAWDVVVNGGESIRFGRFSWLRGGTMVLADELLPAAESSQWWPAIETGDRVRGYLDWVRFPWVEVDASTPAGGRTIYVMDARYVRRRTTGFGGVVIEAAGEAAGGGER